MKKLLDWLDERAGWRDAAKFLLDEPVPGGARFAYVFGSVLVFLLIMQMTTGVLLAFYYAPSSTDAWASVAHIEDTVTLGWLVRGLHHHGASAMVIVAGLHLLQTALWGAHKKPRELNWITGVLLLGLLLAFALTGYLLPWDQTGYWATKVATGIAGQSPLIGAKLQQAAQGGNEYGNLTLTRFYALHVFVLPALMLGLVGIHLLLFRRHGVTPSARLSPDEQKRRTQPFWPDQLFKDVLAMAVVFAALFGWTWSQHGARLDAPADPSSNFDARPEWYFRPLYQMLKYFSGSMETVAALGVPAIVGAYLLALPFLDRKVARRPRWPVAPVLLGLVAVGALTLLSYRQDAADPDLAKRQDAADVDALRARHLAAQNGVPASGGVAVFTTAKFYRARAIWKHDCQSCHEGDKRKGPLLGPGYNSRAWIKAFLKAPNSEPFFGHTELGKSDKAMDPVDLPDDQMTALMEAVYAETGATDAKQELAKKGRDLFAGDASCTDCHAPLGAAPAAPPAPAAPVVDAGAAKASGDSSGDDDGGDEAPSAPNLNGRGSPAYLVGLLRDASAPGFFDGHNEMQVFIDDLAPLDLHDLADWLIWLRTATADDVNALDQP